MTTINEYTFAGDYILIAKCTRKDGKCDTYTRDIDFDNETIKGVVLKLKRTTRISIDSTIFSIHLCNSDISDTPVIQFRVSNGKYSFF